MVLKFWPLMAFVGLHWPFWPSLASIQFLKPFKAKIHWKHSKSHSLNLSKVSNNFRRISLNLNHCGILYWPLYLFLAGRKKSHYCRDQICLNDSGNLHSLHLGSIFQDFLGHWSCHTDEYGNRAYWRPSVSNSSGYERSKVMPFVEL